MKAIVSLPGLRTPATGPYFESNEYSPLSRNPVFNPLKPSGHYMYRLVYHPQILRSAHTVYLCVLCGSENKQRLFPYTALTGWFL